MRQLAMIDARARSSTQKYVHAKTIMQYTKHRLVSSKLHVLIFKNACEKHIVRATKQHHFFVFDLLLTRC